MQLEDEVKILKHAFSEHRSDFAKFGDSQVMRKNYEIRDFLRSSLRSAVESAERISKVGRSDEEILAFSRLEEFFCGLAERLKVWKDR